MRPTEGSVNGGELGTRGGQPPGTRDEARTRGVARKITLRRGREERREGGAVSGGAARTPRGVRERGRCPARTSDAKSQGKPTRFLRSGDDRSRATRTRIDAGVRGGEMRWTYASWDDLVRIDSRALGVWRRLIRHRRDNAFGGKQRDPPGDRCARAAGFLPAHPAKLLTVRACTRETAFHQRALDPMKSSILRWNFTDSRRSNAPLRFESSWHSTTRGQSPKISPAGPGARSFRRCPLGERIALGRHCGRRRAFLSREERTRPSPRARTPLPARLGATGAATRPPPKGTRPVRPLRSAARRRISLQSRSVPRLGGRCRPWTRRSRVPRTWTRSS